MVFNLLCIKKDMRSNQKYSIILRLTMSVIIRLQNLPWSANALDIRQYFHGLNIPEGGVHIVGGELGDAFIAFRYDMNNF